MIEQYLKPYTQSYFLKIASWCIKLGITPQQITVAALFFGLASAIGIATGYRFLAAILLACSGIADVLDGTVARQSGAMHPVGGYCDLLADRLVEAAVLTGFAYRYPAYGFLFTACLGAILFHFATFVLAGVLFENTGPKSMHFEPSLIERAEAFMAFFGMIAFEQLQVFILSILTILILITAYQRFMLIYHKI